MPTPLTILSDEHKNIIKVLDALNKECTALQSGGEIKISFFRKVIDFVRGYADKFHHAKEEDILFVELNNSEAMPCNPIPQMLHEHDLGRNFIKEMETGLEQENKDMIVENARGYANLLQEHIFKEDNILYPMINEALNDEAKNQILEKFKQVERESIVDREKFLLFIEEL